jgi:MFS transporter, DHA1 family, inner membrane transport protein
VEGCGLRAGGSQDEIVTGAMPRPESFFSALFALALGSFALGTGEFVSMGLLPNVANDLGVSIPDAGHMISAYAIGVVVGAPVITVLFAKARRRQLLIGLALMLTLGNLASAMAPHFRAMVLARFITGLPHGAYFGIASLVAVSLVAPKQRAQAVGRVLLGLSLANVFGVPFATAIGQALGWRAAFLSVAGIALLTAVLVRLRVPDAPADLDASPLRELSALKSPQVWLTLGVAGIGFGGMFAVYSYLAPTLTEVTGTPAAAVPVFLAIIGVGMVLGSLAGGWLADRSVARAVMISLLWTIMAMIVFVLAAPHRDVMVVAVFLIGGCIAMGPPLQTRLMDVAGDGQALAAALNHSAFNLANALGAWLGGLTIAAGFGWTSTGWLGALLAAGGLLILTFSLALERNARHGELKGSARESDLRAPG